MTHPTTKTTRTTRVKCGNNSSEERQQRQQLSLNNKRQTESTKKYLIELNCLLLLPIAIGQFSKPSRLDKTQSTKLLAKWKGPKTKGHIEGWLAVRQGEKERDREGNNVDEAEIL